MELKMQTQIAYKNDLGHELVAFGAEGVTAEQIAKANGFESGTWREITMEEASELSELTPEEQKQVRTVEIKSRLLEIDLESVRPLRARVYGTATLEDDAKLAALEQEAEALRAELAG